MEQARCVGVEDVVQHGQIQRGAGVATSGKLREHRLRMKDVAASLGLKPQVASQKGVKKPLVLGTLTRARKAGEELDDLQYIGLLVLGLGAAGHACADEDAKRASEVVLVHKRGALTVHQQLLKQHGECTGKVGTRVCVLAQAGPALLVVLDVEDAPVLAVAIAVKPLVGVVDDDAARVLAADVGVLHRGLREGRRVLEAEALRGQLLTEAPPLTVRLGAAAVPLVDEDEVVALEERWADRVRARLGPELRNLDDVHVGLAKGQAELRTLLEHATTEARRVHLANVLATETRIGSDQQDVVRRRLSMTLERCLVLKEVRVQEQGLSGSRGLPERELGEVVGARVLVEPVGLEIKASLAIEGRQEAVETGPKSIAVGEVPLEIQLREQESEVLEVLPPDRLGAPSLVDLVGDREDASIESIEVRVRQHLEWEEPVFQCLGVGRRRGEPRLPLGGLERFSR